MASARDLADSGVAVTVDVVGFDVETDADRRALEAIAEASGGTYTDARDAAQLDDYVDSLLRQRNEALSASICLKQVVGRARTCQGHHRREAEALIRRSVERSNELASEYAPAIERREKAVREAQECYEQAYGRPISLSPVPCPYLNGSVTLAATSGRRPT